MTILKTIDINDLEGKREPLSHHKLGLSYTASGYGKKIPTEFMVKLPDAYGWRRVYCCIYSNVGTCYVEHGKNKDWVVITGTPRF